MPRLSMLQPSTELYRTSGIVVTSRRWTGKRKRNKRQKTKEKIKGKRDKRDVTCLHSLSKKKNLKLRAHMVTPFFNKKEKKDSCKPHNPKALYSEPSRTGLLGIYQYGSIMENGPKPRTIQKPSNRAGMIPYCTGEFRPIQSRSGQTM